MRSFIDLFLSSTFACVTFAQVPVNNSFPAYAPFTRTKSNRYVFEQYDSTRGATLFQPKDRLYLTRSIMLRFMDLDILDDYDAIKVCWWWWCEHRERMSTAHLLSSPMLFLALPQNYPFFQPLNLCLCTLVLLWSGIYIHMRFFSRIFFIFLTLCLFLNLSHSYLFSSLAPLLLSLHTQSSMALHDANRGEYDDLSRLKSIWVNPFAAAKSDIGSIEVDSPYLEGDELPPMFRWLWCQPHVDVHAYFGSEVALYFLWLGHLSFAYLAPALVGLVAVLYYAAAGYSWCETGFQAGTYFEIACGLFVSMWAVAYKNDWASQQKLAALKFGTKGAEATEHDRPQFRGTEYHRDPVTLREVLYYPEAKRFPLQIWSNFLVFGLLVALVAEIDLLMFLEGDLDSTGGTFLVFSIVALQIPLFTSLFNAVALALNESENHQTESAFNDALVFKVCTFEFVNVFGALLYVAFVKEYTYGCKGGCCMDQLAELTGFMFGMQGLIMVWDFVAPMVVSAYENYVRANELRQAAAMKEALANDDTLDSEELVNKLEPWEKELYLDTFPGFFAEYQNRIFNFGLATMFVVPFPAAPLITLVLTTAKCRILAHKLCTLYRRPNPERQEDIGTWETVMAYMCSACILSNTGILVFTSNTFRFVSADARVVIFLATVQVLFGLQALVSSYFPTESENYKRLCKRHEYLVEKHIYGFQDLSDSKVASSGAGDSNDPKGGGGDDSNDGGTAKRGHIDLGPLEEQILKKAESSGAGAIPELKEVDMELEQVKRELTISKDRLTAALKTEVYNEKTGIGETIHGLPLGCLSLKLIMLEGVTVSSAKNVSVVVSLKSTKRDDSAAPGPPAQVSKAGRANATSTKQAIDFNQTFTLAPVKSHDAQLIFDLMDAGADPKRRGTCKIHLRDLADQLDSNKTLPILVRQGGGAEGKFEAEEGAKLFARVKFQYSKVLPLRTKIYELQDQERTLRAKKTALRLSKSKT